MSVVSEGWLPGKFCRERFDGSLEYSMFEVLVQLLEPDLIEAVMREEVFQVRVNVWL